MAARVLEDSFRRLDVARDPAGAAAVQAAAAAAAGPPPPPALLARLNAEQLAVAQFAIDRPLLVLACAGTGKTTTLMARVAEMLRQSVAAQSILVLTYTKKMALEFRTRLVRDVAGAERVRVSTVHAFCYDVLRRHYRELGYPRCPTVISSQDMEQTIRLCCKLVKLERLLDDACRWLELPRTQSGWQTVVDKAWQLSPQRVDRLLGEVCGSLGGGQPAAGFPQQQQQQQQQHGGQPPLTYSQQGSNSSQQWSPQQWSQASAGSSQAAATQAFVGEPISSQGQATHCAPTSQQSPHKRKADASSGSGGASALASPPKAQRSVARFSSPLAARMAGRGGGTAAGPAADGARNGGVPARGASPNGSQPGTPQLAELHPAVQTVLLDRLYGVLCHNFEPQLHRQLSERLRREGAIDAQGEVCFAAEPTKERVRKLKRWLELHKGKGSRPEHFGPTEERAVWELYRRELHRQGLVDFGDMLAQVRGMLEDPHQSHVLEGLRRRFTHLLVDEFQDCNLLQVAIVVLLGGGSGRVTVVGDDDQSIYRFMAATPGVFQLFKDAMADEGHSVSQLLLVRNYRSPPNVLHVGRALLAANPGRTAKELEAALPDDGLPVPIVCWPNEEAEAHGVALEARRLHEQQGYGWRDMAVLYRFFRHGGRKYHLLQKAFDNVGVPHRLMRDKPVLTVRAVQVLIGYLKLLLNPDDDAALLTVLNEPPRGLGIKAEEVLQQLQDGFRLRPGCEVPSLAECARRLGEGECAEAAALDARQRRGLCSLLEQLHQLRRELYLRRPAEIIDRVLHVTGFYTHLTNQQRRAVASPDQRGFYDAASSDDEFADAEDVWLLSQEHAGASQQQQQQLGSQEQTQLAHAQQSQEPQPPSQPGSAAASPEQRRGSQGPALTPAGASQPDEPFAEYRLCCKLTRALGAVAKAARAFSQDLEQQAAVPEAEAAGMEQRLLGLLAQAGLLPGGGSGGGGSDLGAAAKPEPVDGTPATMPCTPPAAPAAEAEAAAAAAALGRGPHVLSDFMTLLTEMPDMGAELDAEEQGKGRLDDAVTICTMHSAKGLEWPVVFTPMFCNQFFPWPGGFAKSELPEPLEPPRLGGRELPLGDSPLEDEAEERRLAHVACTRAKRLHVISYPSTVVDGRGKPLPARRSKFLDEMMCALEEGRGMAGVVELRTGG